MVLIFADNAAYYNADISNDVVVLCHYHTTIVSLLQILLLTDCILNSVVDCELDVYIGADFSFVSSPSLYLPYFSLLLPLLFPASSLLQSVPRLSNSSIRGLHTAGAW